MSSKRHEAVFDDVLSGLDSDAESVSAKSGSRFLKRSTALGERMTGEREEKLLHWVDPDQCCMWERHNRDYSLLTEENCRDLIDGIRAQGQQEFPAIVRRLQGSSRPYEVICGARRHFAVSWLRANNYPQFKYLIEVRDLTDEEAFRLADIENRERDDISDFERARDYAAAIGLYYGGKQKAMAERLDVSEAWLSRYLALARLPDPVVKAFSSIRDIRELHARTLKPLLADNLLGREVLAEARKIADEQADAREGRGEALSAPEVVARLRTAARPAKPKPSVRRYAAGPEDGSGAAITARRSGRKTVLDVPDTLSRAGAEAAFQKFLDDQFADG